jgi:hypothetical protein
MVHPHRLFVEIFPINTSKIPPLFAYQVNLEAEAYPFILSLGSKLEYRLKSKFSGHWIWDPQEKIFITDTLTPLAPLKRSIQEVWSVQEKDFLKITSIYRIPDWSPSPRILADFVVRGLLEDWTPKIQKILSQGRRERRLSFVELSCEKRACLVQGQPSLSLSVFSRLCSRFDLNTFMERVSDPQTLKGLSVLDQTKPQFTNGMELTGILGKVKDYRESLLKFDLNPEMRKIVENAGEDEWVVETNHRYHYVSRALAIHIRQKDFSRFRLSENLQISPEKRSHFIQPIAHLIQETCFMGRAYNSKTHPRFFLESSQIGFTPYVQFAQGKIGEISSAWENLLKYGCYKVSPSLAQQPLRIGILNAVSSFALEGSRNSIRKLLQQLQFQAVLTGVEEIQDPETLQKSIDTLQEKASHILLAIVPNPSSWNKKAQTLQALLKKLTISQDISYHCIPRSHLYSPLLLKQAVLSLLCKTGNTPYVLAQPLPYTDEFVGLSVLPKTQTLPPTPKNSQRYTRYTLMARVYHAHGEFSRYHLQETETLQNFIPANDLQALFPAEFFSGKRVLLHRQGRFQKRERLALLHWGQKIQTQFFFVDILKKHVPRLYAQNQHKILPAPQGSIFKINSHEALFVSSSFSPQFQATPQPLRICTYPPFTIEKALHSVLSLTLLHYGSNLPLKLPVTTSSSDKIFELTQQGSSPESQYGQVPFWL